MVIYIDYIGENFGTLNCVRAIRVQASEVQMYIQCFYIQVQYLLQVLNMYLKVTSIQIFSQSFIFLIKSYLLAKCNRIFGARALPRKLTGQTVFLPFSHLYTTEAPKSVYLA